MRSAGGTALAPQNLDGVSASPALLIICSDNNMVTLPFIHTAKIRADEELSGKTHLFTPALTDLLSNTGEPEHRGTGTLRNRNFAACDVLHVNADAVR
ncbi:hypothetical protein MHYP_G00288870 [Metynnis hypsauchen]